MINLLSRVGWSQVFFAKLMGVSTRTVYNWCHKEPGEPAMRYLELVARVLNV